MKKLSDHIYMTNGDRIRAMSDEELAEIVVSSFGSPFNCRRCEEEPNSPFGVPSCDAKCMEHCLNWLRQPAKEV